tara:strand:+ start:168 stop:380 length:213 start_codon:yes stop_codon:yes gene_type:complete
MVKQEKVKENTRNRENRTFETCEEKNSTTSIYSESYIDTKLIINHNINGINIAELYFKISHFFVEIFIFK